MTPANDHIKDQILESALSDVPFDGWTGPVLKNAAVKSGFAPEMAVSVFPSGVRSALDYFADRADRRMLDALSDVDVNALRVRERIALAVRARLDVLEPYKEAERLAVAYWMRPLRKWEGAKIVWRTADRIWNWAGDTAADYNRLTKRTLLSGVITSTVLYWLTDESAEHADTAAFLDRRIDNVLSIGKIVGKFKKA